MGTRRGKTSLATVVAAAIVLPGAAATVLDGCGGSGSSSSERTKLEHQLSAQAKASSLPADLSSCVVQQAGNLPIDQLRKVADAGLNAPTGTKRIAIRLVAACIRQGKGLATIHALIIQPIERSSSPTVPPVFKRCVIQKANATTGEQLSQLVAAYAGNDLATAQKQAFQVGVGLGRQCLGDPQIIGALRSRFMTPIKTALRQSAYSAAFKNCVLHKSERVPASLLREAALNPAGASVLGQRFGRNAARACIASGARP